MMLAAKIRKLAQMGQYGHARTPANFSMGESYCSFYWNNHGVFSDHAEWIQAARVLARYHRFVRFVREIAPEWREVDRIHWMDNSVDVVEVDKDGNQRRRMVLAPSGDACF